ncbi:MAG: hypothetical protein U9N55_09290 [candidate division Zixibacteria bacterium]|nr:hypothetical protein [candidate division Zixibacteria bacterium]
MIIKSFTGESTKEAMKMLRSEMGGEAVVLKTRQMKGHNGAVQVEITACMERPTVSQAAKILREQPSSNSNRLTNDTMQSKMLQKTHSSDSQRMKPLSTDKKISEKPKERIKAKEKAIETQMAADTDIGKKPNTKAKAVPSDDDAGIVRMEQKLDRLLRLNLVSSEDSTMAQKFSPIVSIMKDADLPREFIEKFFISCFDKYDTSEEIMGFTRRELVNALAEMMTPSLSFSNGDRVMFLGHAGVGKSSVMGKLAAQLVTQGKQKIKLAGLDFQKVAALEELAVYADLLSVEMSEVDKKEDKDAVILIDTPAIPTDIEKRSALENLVGKTNTTHRIAVFSALTRTTDIAFLARQLKPMLPTHIAITMLDMTNRWGSIAAIARALEVPVVFINEAPGGIGKIGIPDPNRFAQTILKDGVIHE